MRFTRLLPARLDGKKPYNLDLKLKIQLRPSAAHEMITH